MSLFWYPDIMTNGNCPSRPWHAMATVRSLPSSSWVSSSLASCACSRYRAPNRLLERTNELGWFFVWVVQKIQRLHMVNHGKPNNFITHPQNHPNGGFMALGFSLFEKSKIFRDDPDIPCEVSWTLWRIGHRILTSVAQVGKLWYLLET